MISFRMYTRSLYSCDKIITLPCKLRIKLLLEISHGTLKPAHLILLPFTNNVTEQGLIIVLLETTCKKTCKLGSNQFFILNTNNNLQHMIQQIFRQ